MPRNGSQVACFERKIIGELTLHIEEPLPGVRRSAIELVGKRLRSNDIGECADLAGRAVLPGFRGEARIIVVAAAAGGVARDVEARIPLVLVVERARASANRPFRGRAPGDTDAGSEVVVVTIH